MPKISRTALVMYPVQAMYDLVSDLESYPEFLPWCKEAKVLKKEKNEVEAEMVFAKGQIKQSFSTRNQMFYGSSIEMNLLEGPFSRLTGVWHFKSLGSEGCKVSLEMDFEVANKLLSVTLSPLFGQVMNSMVDAFSQRAKHIYG